MMWYTAEELAVSIMGEMVMCLRGGEGVPLKMRSENLGEMIGKVSEASVT